MANATQPLNITEFDGGLNLRANEFRLADNQSPDMLNVEIDPSGGIATRRGWDRFNSAEITDGVWDPRNAVAHELASGLDIILVANEGNIYRSTDGTFAVLETSGGPVGCSADPHLADFAPWGDKLYVACGHDEAPVRIDGAAAVAVELVPSGAANWNNDYLAPTAGNMPQADFVAAHAGTLWVASTFENGEHFPHRVRWSHPNQPEAWKQLDFEDILEGGGPITGIVPFEDHCLVFKQSSVWAIYGYDTDSRQIINVSRTVGAYNRQVIARSENAVFFFSWPEGVFQIAGGKINEISVLLRPAFQSQEWNTAANSQMWLGWLGRRLWLSAPYHETDVATDARSVFVYDPSLEAWTMFRAGNGDALGPYAQGSFGNDSFGFYGCARTSPDVVRVEALGIASDNLDGELVPFASSYSTRWLHAKWPDRKKRWKRPTFVARSEGLAYKLRCSVYIDYEEAEPKRRFDVNVGGDGDAILYDNEETYDSGAVYGTGVKGSDLERGGSFGSAKAVQLKIDGELGKSWGIEAIICKYRMRRFT